MATREENQLDQFITRRMLRYCKEVGMNYYESTRAMHMNARDREAYQEAWFDAASLN